MTKALELVGQRFGRLTVVERVFQRNCLGCSVWKCLCDCGAYVTVQRGHLKSGNTRSCGCLKLDSISNINKTHGMSGNTLYSIWKGMVARCTNNSCKTFGYYGGRGIKICEEWLIFENFYAWAKPLYSNGLELDRIDNDGDYEPNNCRFTTRSVNNANKRSRGSKSGYIGVYKRGKWLVTQISYENKHYYLGSFPTIKEAVEARNSYIIKNNFPHKLQEVSE